MRPTPERRDQILARSAELFATRGIAGTTVREIGDAAGVFSGSLYHYFPSKHAIVSTILEQFLADIHRRFRSVVEHSTSPENTVRGLVRQTLDVIDEHPHPTAIYQNDRQYLREHGLLEPVDESSRAVRSYWMTAIEAGRAAGSFRDDVPAEIFYRAVRDLLWATMHWPNRNSYSTADFADLIAGLFFDGVRCRPDTPPPHAPSPSQGATHE